MGNEEKKELKDRGFFILEKIHIIWTIVTMVIVFVASIIAQRELMANTVRNHEERIIYLENRDKVKHDILLELKYNLKALMEKSGIKYQDIINSNN